MLQNDPQTKLLLVELAKELSAKADDPDGAESFAIPRWIKERPRTAARDGTRADGLEAGAYRLTPPDPPRRRRGPENPPA